MMQPAILRASVVFFWATVQYLTVWKYCLRGYRDIFLDAGNIYQNCYLVAGQYDLGVCSIRAFSNDEAVQALHLTDDQVLLYAAAFCVPLEVQL